MKRLALATILVAASVTVTNSASAAKKCNIVGSWTDKYGVAATFTTNKRGTADAPAVCGKSYKLVVATLTSTSFDVDGTPNKKTTCPTVDAALTFATGSCTSASGNVVIGGSQTLPDVWTKSAAALRTRPVDSATLTGGLK